jgi:hypothetical protein
VGEFTDWSAYASTHWDATAADLLASLGARFAAAPFRGDEEMT